MVGVYTKLAEAWRTQRSLVCVGLDPEWERLPPSLRNAEQPYFEFGRAIVDATAPYVCAFKPQFAHFAAVGREDELAGLLAYIKEAWPHLLTILDAKRGDIGSTAAFYATEAYERYDADAVTLNPYLGYESVSPYLDFAERGIVVLCRTSNPDSNWLQNDPNDTEPVYQRVARRVSTWNGNQQCMLVAGATYPDELRQIRQIVGDMPLLVPGIGAQGGDLRAVLEAGLDAAGTGLLISSSRGIIYAGAGTGEAVGEGFADAAADAARDLQEAINKFRN